MSFVNLMGSDVWSELDIVNRTESMIRQYFTPQAETIINRKATGMTLGQYTLNSDEQAELMRYAQVCASAAAEGNAARADMVLLQAVMKHEAAVRRLSLEPQPETVAETLEQVPNPLYEQDTIERAEASLKVSEASVEVLALYELRNPVSEPPTPTPGPTSPEQEPNYVP